MIQKKINKILIYILGKIHFFFSDKLYLKIKFYLMMGKKLNLNNPQTMNEKLQWLKLYNRKPIYTNMVDKILSKEYVSNIIGKEYIIPTLAVWDTLDKMDVTNLPDKFVIKTNNGGGNNGVYICKNKKDFDKLKCTNKMKKSLNLDIYNIHKEWPYKNIQKKIFAETYLEDNLGELSDYKFYCFNGYVDCVLVCVDRNIGSPKFYFFDRNWRLKRYNKRGKEAPINFSLPKPQNLEKMFEIAEILSKGIPHIRVDLYNVNGRIYFGELTFFTDSGFDANRLPESDLYFGSLIELDTNRNI